jgi:hypothetical protein
MAMGNEQITLISFFRFQGRARIWGMKQMRDTQHGLEGIQGLRFHKMLGTGGGSGYGFKPDLGTYALLTVWENPDMAETFESGSELMKVFGEHAIEKYSIFLSNLQSRGYWSKQEPFLPGEPDPNNKLIAVLTRATLKARYYYQFWKRVGRVSQSHIGLPGLIFTKGVGERPWIMQATFSVWRSVEDMTAFAHQKDGKHFEAIQTTRRLNGFKEELYARFQPKMSKGSWFGKDPVGETLVKEKE